MHDTQTVVDLVADRELELGIVGAARRHRAVRFEPFLQDEVILICPPGHPFAGRTVSVDELRAEVLIVMQEGAGVRQVVEDELRRTGVRLRDLGVQLELGLQESVRSAVQAGYGVTFISRTAVESDLAAGTARQRRASTEWRRRVRSRSFVAPAGFRPEWPRRSSSSRVRAPLEGVALPTPLYFVAPTTRRRLTTPIT